MELIDIVEIMDASIETLKDPETIFLDIDRELELLIELKKFVKENFNNQSIIENYKIKVEDLNKTVSDLNVEKAVLETKYNEFAD